MTFSTLDPWNGFNRPEESMPCINPPNYGTYFLPCIHYSLGRCISHIAYNTCKNIKFPNPPNRINPWIYGASKEDFTSIERRFSLKWE